MSVRLYFYPLDVPFHETKYLVITVLSFLCDFSFYKCPDTKQNQFILWYLMIFFWVFPSCSRNFSQEHISIHVKLYQSHLLHSLDRASRYTCLMKTNKMNFSFLIYSNNLSATCFVHRNYSSSLTEFHSNRVST